MLFVFTDELVVPTASSNTMGRKILSLPVPRAGATNFSSPSSSIKHIRKKYLQVLPRTARIFSCSSMNVKPLPLRKTIRVRPTYKYKYYNSKSCSIPTSTRRTLFRPQKCSLHQIVSAEQRECFPHFFRQPRVPDAEHGGVIVGRGAHLREDHPPRAPRQRLRHVHDVGVRDLSRVQRLADAGHQRKKLGHVVHVLDELPHRHAVAVHDHHHARLPRRPHQPVLGLQRQHPAVVHFVLRVGGEHPPQVHALGRPVLHGPVLFVQKKRRGDGERRHQSADPGADRVRIVRQRLRVVGRRGGGHRGVLLGEGPGRLRRAARRPLVRFLVRGAEQAGEKEAAPRSCFGLALVAQRPLRLLEQLGLVRGLEVGIIGLGAGAGGAICLFLLRLRCEAQDRVTHLQLPRGQVQNRLRHRAAVAYLRRRLQKRVGVTAEGGQREHKVGAEAAGRIFSLLALRDGLRQLRDGLVVNEGHAGGRKRLRLEHVQRATAVREQFSGSVRGG
mmetsp:Transcript_3896/g.9475  ORF Transcript_3896/g.9475 Transcript_3896/m.9475 type:complete len:500 (+) Transcript_3896:428-1927(+)